MNDQTVGRPVSRVALVTGGTRGIGRAISIALRDAGYRVVANYGGCDRAAAEFHAETGIPVYKFDVADFEAVRENIQRIEREHGPIEVLVNNAGITRDAVLHKMTPQMWEDVIRTDLGGVFNTCRNVIEGMRARRYGRIINIGSVNGQAGEYGQVNYCAAKSGIHGFNKALALESAKYGITVNAIAPGAIETDMLMSVPSHILEKIKAKIPVGRFGQPWEVARAVVFLAAEESSFITGLTLSINGGQHMY
ncbi:MAG: beta-ketoacyl-ACP reductase [Porticoccaceae bacterium]|nr:MAG: beta-ketoacyl-ACP reductase [Porticoccaceae bacterium]